MAPKHREFFFVNKNSSSSTLSRSDPEEKATILSHVQSRRRRNAQARTRADPWAKYSFVMNKDGTRQEDDPSSSDSDSTSTASTAGSAHLPLNFPVDNGSDPFYCTVVGKVPNLHHLLHHAVTQTARTVFLANAFAPESVIGTRPEMRHDLMVTERLRQCISNPMLMYSTLAYGSSTLSWMFGPRADIDEHHHDPPEYFLSKAIPAVRSRLSEIRGQAPDPWLMLSIYSLAIIDLWNGLPSSFWKTWPPTHVPDHASLKTCRMHLRALIKLMEDAGGWEKVEPYAFESFVMGDKYLAITESTVPLIPTTWDPGAFVPTPSENFSRLAILPRLGSTLLQIPMQADLYQILVDLVDYVRVSLYFWGRGDIDRARETWLYRRLQAIICRLLWLTDLSSVDDCIRITTLIFTCSATQYHGAQIAASTLLARLKKALVRAISEGSISPSLLFWCLCTGAIVGQPAPDKAWFVDEFVNICNNLSLDVDFYTFQDRLASYLYIADRQSAQLSDLVYNVATSGAWSGRNIMTLAY